MSIGVPGVSSAEKIGQGGFGIVYRAHQDSFDRTVAVKVLSAVDLNAEAHERFAREVRAVGRLSGHPNIVSVYEHGTTTSGAPYLLMEYCERGSYGDVLRNGQRLSWERAVDVGICIADALDATHQGGLLHRDVKPDNILVAREGERARLMDFGVAIIRDLGEFESQVFRTVEGGATGTPQFMSPEQAAGDTVGPGSDLYSLALVLYLALSGRLPFTSETSNGFMACHMLEEPLPLAKASAATKGLPRELHELMTGLLDKNPAKRPTCEQVIATLGRLEAQVGEASKDRKSGLLGFLWGRR